VVISGGAAGPLAPANGWPDGRGVSVPAWRKATDPPPTTAIRCEACRGVPHDRSTPIPAESSPYGIRGPADRAGQMAAPVGWTAIRPARDMMMWRGNLGRTRKIAGRWISASATFLPLTIWARPFTSWRFRETWPEGDGAKTARRDPATRWRPSLAITQDPILPTTRRYRTRSGWGFTVRNGIAILAGALAKPVWVWAGRFFSADGGGALRRIATRNSSSLDPTRRFSTGGRRLGDWASTVTQVDNALRRMLGGDKLLSLRI